MTPADGRLMLGCTELVANLNFWRSVAGKHSVGESHSLVVSVLQDRP